MTAITVFFTLFVISAVTVVLVLLIKTIYQKKFTPVFHYYIWGLLIIRLIFPILPGSQVSLFNLIPSVDAFFPASSVSGGSDMHEAVQADNTGGISADSPHTSTSEPDSIQDDFSTENLAFDISYEEDAAGTNRALSIAVYTVYGTVTLLLILYTTAGYFFRIKKIKSESQPCRDDDILEMARYISQDLGIKKQIPIRFGKKSMVIGILHPCVIISASNLKDAEMVLIHELTHCRYRDNISGILFEYLKCIYWFNPIVWYAAKRFMVDMEILCDYRVIKRFGLKREEYAMLLFSTVDTSGHNRDSGIPASAPAMSKAGKQLIKRLNYMARQRKFKTGPFARITAVLLVAAMTALCLTNPVSAVIRADDTDFIMLYNTFAEKRGTKLPDKDDIMTSSGYVNALFLAFADTVLPDAPKARLNRMIRLGAEHFLTVTLGEAVRKNEPEVFSGLKDTLEPDSRLDLDTAAFILTSFVTLLQNDTLYGEHSRLPEAVSLSDTAIDLPSIVGLALGGLPFSLPAESFSEKLIGTCRNREVRNTISLCYTESDGICRLDLSLSHKTLSELAGYVKEYTEYTVSDMQNDYAETGYSLLSLCIDYLEPYKIVACGANGSDIECSIYFGDYFRHLCLLSSDDNARSALKKLFISQDPTSAELSARERQEMINKFGIKSEFFILDQYASGEELAYLKQIIADCAACFGGVVLYAAESGTDYTDERSLLTACGVLDESDIALSDESITFSAACEQIMRLRAALMPR